MEVLFFLSVGFVAYTYVVYPLILLIWSTLFPRAVDRRYQHLPVTVVIAVNNEEDKIGARIDNILAQDYPPELIELIVVSDGSTDRTVEIARERASERVHILDCEATGKAGALNTGVANASHDIVVFADARQRFDNGVVADLASMFYDEKVGAVSGELIIAPSSTSEVGESVGLYWSYEKLIRRMEGRIDSVVGATGSIYAIRRELYVPLEEHTLLDDFLVPMRIVLQGYRVVFSRAAQAHDIASSTTSQEFGRKVRTLAGNFQAVAMEPLLLNPVRNRIFFQFVSHKLCRLAVPYFCVFALVTSALIPSAPFRVVFIAQLVFYLMGFLSRTSISMGPVGKLVRFSWTFVVLNAAAVAGFWVWATGRADAAWKKA